MKMVEWFKKHFPGSDKHAITELRHELKNSIQAVQSGNRVLRSYQGMVELNRRSPKS